MKNGYIKAVLSILILLTIVNNLIFIPDNILSWDVFGYYLYLPFKFIYNDIRILNESVVHSIIEQYHNTGTFYQAMKMPDGGFVMKYSMGWAVLYFPFFMIGHLVAMLSDFPTDGFSKPYQMAIFMGAILYSILGLFFLAKVLRHFFSDKISALVLIVLFFGTNYFVHITMYGQNSMSHNHLFLSYSLVLWLTIRWHESHKIKHAILLATVCGLSILSRPSEIVCLLIPVFWGVWNKDSLYEKLSLIIKHKKQVLVFALILIFIGLPQFIYWKLSTGKFLFNSYGGNAGEGFEFLSPYILNVLFSFRKGWLIYTPIMILAIIGFYFLYRKNKSISLSILVFFVVNLYFVSSWSCWWYAQSFSQRALVSSYPIMALGFGYFFMWANDKTKHFKIFVSILIFGLIYLNLFQTYQFHHGVLHGDRMTKDYYFRVFGKRYATEEDRKHLLIDRAFDGSENFNPENYRVKKTLGLDFENTGKQSEVAFSGAGAFKLDSATIYSTSIEVPYYEITSEDHAWLEISAYVYSSQDAVLNPFSLVVHFTHNGYAYKYKALDSENLVLETNKWKKISLMYLTPEVRRPENKLKVYIWHRGKLPLYVDDLQINVFEKENKD